MILRLLMAAAFLLGGMIMLTINGKEYELNGKTVAEALAETGYGEQRVAVELNESIVPRDQYASTVLYEGDHLEVVRFVGGG